VLAVFLYPSDMQFKNLTVAKKVWLLLLTVITTMLLSGLGMTSYLKSVDQRVMDSILDMEERIRLVVQLRGNTQATASYLVAANMAQDTTSIDFFNQQFKTASVEANALLTETNQRVESAEGLAVMARLADQRKKLQQLTEQIAMERRNDGDVGRMVQSELVPTVDQYMDILDELVALQQKMLSAAIQKGKAEGELAMTVGGIALALVIALGLLLSAWLVRQLTAPLARAVELAETIAAGDLPKMCTMTARTSWVSCCAA